MIESWHPDFVLTVGDNAYPLGAPELLDRRHLRPYARALMRESAWFPALGNHDVKANGGSPSSRRSTRSATSAGTASRGERCSRRAGLERFRRPRLAAAALRPQRPGPGLLLPLRRLAPPAVGAPGTRIAPGLRRNIVPLVEKNGVQVVFDGHLHAYARSRPHNGVLYVAVGTGGAELDYDAGDLTILIRARRPGPLRGPPGGRRR